MGITTSTETDINSIEYNIKNTNKTQPVLVESTIAFIDNKNQNARSSLLYDNNTRKLSRISPHISHRLINVETNVETSGEDKTNSIKKNIHDDQGVSYTNKAILYMGVSNDIYMNYKIKDDNFLRVVMILDSLHIFGQLIGDYWVFDKLKKIPMFKLSNVGIIEIIPHSKKNTDSIKYVTIIYQIVTVPDDIYFKYKRKNIKSGNYIFTNSGIY